MVTNPKDLLAPGAEVLAPANNIDALAINAIKNRLANPESKLTQVILVPIYTKLANLEKNIVVAYDTIISVAANRLMELTSIKKGLIGTKLTFDPSTNIISVTSFNKSAADTAMTANNRGSNLAFNAHVNHVLVKTKEGDKLFKQIVIKDDENNGAKTIADLFFLLTTKFGDTDQLNGRSKIDFGHLLPLFGQKRTTMIGKGAQIAQMFAGTLVSMDFKAFTTNSNIKKIVTTAVEKGGQHVDVLVKALNASIGFPADFPTNEVFLLGEVKTWGTMVSEAGETKPIENLTLAEVYKTGIDEAVIADFKGGSFQSSAKFLSQFNPSCEIEGSLLRITFTSKFVQTLSECFAANGYVREQVFNPNESAINPYLGVDIMSGNLDSFQTASRTTTGQTGFIMV
jgi:hypothetical protein